MQRREVPVAPPLGWGASVRYKEKQILGNNTLTYTVPQLECGPASEVLARNCTESLSLGLPDASVCPPQSFAASVGEKGCVTFEFQALETVQDLQK